MDFDKGGREILHGGAQDFIGSGGAQDFMSSQRRVGSCGPIVQFASWLQRCMWRRFL